jgi:hypothetical protein
LKNPGGKFRPDSSFVRHNNARKEDGAWTGQITPDPFFASVHL